jgi:hypothetical protein
MGAKIAGVRTRKSNAQIRAFRRVRGAWQNTGLNKLRTMRRNKIMRAISPIGNPTGQPFARTTNEIHFLRGWRIQNIGISIEWR